MPDTTTELSFSDYVARVASKYHHPTNSLRQGQVAYNELEKLRPDIASLVVGHYARDPFYRADALPTFYEFVESQW